jgi:MtfA peptidase
VIGPKALFRRWNLSRHPIPDVLWEAARAGSPYALKLEPAAGVRLRELCTLFLRAKSFAGTHGLIVTDTMRVHVALHACLPILNLDLEYYTGWKGIVIYPGDFRVRQRFQDDAGVVHEGTEDLCGESLSQGPLVLSWNAIVGEVEHTDQDLVIHECAHKLDLLTGDTDGFPPLHASMDSSRWSETMRRAFDALGAALDRGAETRIDPYAANDPAEFFAVLTETFFTAPAIVYEEFPEAYLQLAAFYRQDPIQRVGNLH